MTFADMLPRRAGLTRCCAWAGPGAGEVPDRLARRRGAHLRFLRAIVDATTTWPAPSPQIAYFAAQRGEEDQLERLIAHIRRGARRAGDPDAKRGDIGATAEQYARGGFERYRADALTLSPFMGFDSIEPYLRWRTRG